MCCAGQPPPTCFRRWQMLSGQQSSNPWGGRKRHSADCASGVCLSPTGAMESCPANAVHSRKSVIFYPVIPVCIAISVRSKSRSETVTPLLCLNGAARCPVPGIASPHAAPGSRRHQKKPSPAGDGFFLCDGDHQILVMSTRSTSLMVVSMSRHSVRAMAVSTAVRQAMDRSTALRRICTECSAGLRPVALVEIR